MLVTTLKTITFVEKYYYGTVVAALHKVIG